MSPTKQKEALGIDQRQTMHSLSQRLIISVLKKPPQMESDLLYQEAYAAGIDHSSMQKFLRFCARGMEWTHQKFPNVAGPADIVFGNANQMARSAVLGEDVPIPDTMSLVTLRKHAPDGTLLAEHHVIAVPYAEIKEMVSTNDLSQFMAQSRRALGALGPEEVMFLAGVEEFYHAVQRQDEAIKQRLAQAEALPQAVAGLLEEHDLKPNELDAVPVLEQGLRFCRDKFGRQRSPGGA